MKADREDNSLEFSNSGNGERRSGSATKSFGLTTDSIYASIFVALAALALRISLIPFLPTPHPAIHDEFSYLLAADTFAHGRLTSPVHPMWIHFETFHELSHPSYASKYPPGQGLVLALGQLFGTPWISVWVSMAILCGVITWAVWEWLEWPWAIVAGLLAMLQLTGTYWTESYWGGSVAAIGGALVFGAMTRLLRHLESRSAFTIGIGLAILANTRPFEGLVFAAACVGVLAFHLVASVRHGELELSSLVKRLAVPIAAIMLPTFLWMGYYNYRVTGHPLLMPYTVYDQQYDLWSRFIWGTHQRPLHHYNHAVLHRFWAGFDTKLTRVRQQHILKSHLIHLVDFARFFLGWPTIACILLSLKELLTNRQWRIPLAIVGIFSCAFLIETDPLPHYVAPAVTMAYLFGAAAIRYVTSWFSSPRMRGAALAIILSINIPFAVARISNPANRFLLHTENHLSFVEERQHVIELLNGLPGKHLVLVKYGPYHSVHREWVFNDADIDDAKIVWARTMHGNMDDELLRYYPNRRIWNLYAGD